MRAIGVAVLSSVAIVAIVVGAGVPRARGDSWLARLSGPGDARALRSPSREGRLQAARDLGRHGDARHAVAALIDALPGEHDPAVRRAIVRSLARRGDPKAVPALIRALAAAEPADATAVADALAAFGTGSATRALVDALDAPPLRPAAVAALRRVGVGAVPYLIRALRSADARQAAMGLLGAAGDPTAVPALASLVAHGRPEVRGAAIAALAAIGDARAAPIVAAHVSDASPEVSLAALRALGSLGGPAQVSLLARRAGAKQPLPQREAALQSLARVDPRRAVPLLGAALAADPPLARAARAIAIDLAHPAMVPLLARLLAHGDAAAADALAVVDGGRGLGALVRAARHPGDPKVAPAVDRSIAVAIHRWGGVPGVPVAAARAVLRQRTGDDARGWALRALAGMTEVAAPARAALGSRAAATRLAGARALELLGRSADAGAIGEALRAERDPDVFRALARAGLALGTRSPIGGLWRWIERAGTAPEAMVLAARSLPGASYRTRERLRETLRARLRAADPRVRAGAAWALAESGDTEAWRALAERLDDSVAEVRLSAARALGVLAAPASLDALAARARVENDPRVRTALSDAIRACRGASAGPPRSFAVAGDEIFRMRVAVAEVHRTLLVDVVLPDGRWLRMRTLPTGELFLTGLPAGTADVRVRVGS